MNENRLSAGEPEAHSPAQPPPLSVEESCQRLTEFLEHILRDAGQARLDVGTLSEPCRPLGEALCSFRAQAEELAACSARLAQGDLSGELPDGGGCLYDGLKSLHANLKQLTLQAGQVTRGEDSPDLCPSGEFFQAFHAMTQQLQEREDRLKEEIQRARRRAEIINSYTEMLMDLLDQRDEWLLVVDQKTQQIVHCNKRTRGIAEGAAYCDSCRHRLPIQSKLLEWSDSERYQVRELEEGRNVCYRVISFPIEWKERPSCVHIVMDITTEKMSARHLNDDIYQDPDTGIRNRQFLSEFMAQVLREQQNITLCYLDLGGVSEINTSFGRKVGDAYIQNFVEIVRKNFRSGDTFARIQDDKFCLMLTGSVKHLIERKMDEILTTFQRDDDRVFSHRCSFKYSIIEVEGASNVMPLDKLLETAEAEVKRQKRRQERQRKTPRGFDFENW